MYHGNRADYGRVRSREHVLTVALIAFAVIAVVWLVRRSAASSTHPATRHGDSGSGSAREVLDRRLALGEIDEDEYGRLRAALSDAPAHSST